MLKYAKVINEETKECEVGLGNPDEIFGKISKTRMVEQTVQVEKTIPAEYDDEGNIISEEQIIYEEETIEVPEDYLEEITIGQYYESLGMRLQDVEQAYSGQWYLSGYAPQQSLDELKTAKRTEINQSRDAAEQGGFTYMGKVFDSDQVSCQRISMAAQAMALAPEGSTITWTCQDNTTIDLNAEELQLLVFELAKWSNTCHQKATELKVQIELAKTVEELEKIKWEDNAAML